MVHFRNPKNNRGNWYAGKTAFIVMVFAMMLFCNWAVAESEHAQPLSQGDRIACQEAIERVYWQHRIWPQDNKQARPSFESIMTA